MSHQASNWAFQQEISGAGLKFVLVALADMADQEHSCYPSQGLLAQRTGQSERAVRQHIATLLDRGLISKEKRFKGRNRTSDRYYLAVDGPFDSTAVTPDPPPADSAGSQSPPPADSAGTEPADSAGTEPADSAGEPSVEPSEKNRQVGRTTRARTRTAKAKAKANPDPSLPLDNVRELKPPAKSESRRYRLPDDWKPSEKLIAWQRENGFPDALARAETVKFKDYWWGCGKPMLNWDSVWKNWIRRAAEDRVRFAPRRSAAVPAHDFDADERTEW